MPFKMFNLDNGAIYPIFAALYRGVEQLVARWAHNPKVTGSSPVSATKNEEIVTNYYIISYDFCLDYVINS